jgi:hypothetical protein
MMARVVATLDGEELTVFLADVVGGGRLRDGEPLTFGLFASMLPKEWLADQPRTADCRRSAPTRTWIASLRLAAGDGDRFPPEIATGIFRSQ